MFSKKTVKDIDVKDKKVLVRVDYNVLDDTGKIVEDYRLKATIPTLEYLLDQNCTIVLASHAGRPEGRHNASLSLKPVAEKLGELLGHQVKFINEAVGSEVQSKVESLKPKEILLLENLRFYPGEEANDATFAKQLAALGEVFVQDAFGAAHRAHASTAAIAQFLPAVAGLLLEKEVTSITAAMEEPKRPLVAIIGGAKIADKITAIERFVDKADKIVIGGALANTFLAYHGYNIGKSVTEADQKPTIEAIYKRVADRVSDGKDPDFPTDAKLFLELPEVDVAVGKKIDANERRNEVFTKDVEDDDYILDFGRASTESVVAAVKGAGTVIWSGPLGMTEFPNFAFGSVEVAQALKEGEATSIIGGGDTSGFILGWDMNGGVDFDLISTGGGASLELIGGKTLPGVAALLDK